MTTQKKTTINAITTIISLVPRRYYPTLSLVSKTFGGFITSPELYAVCSLLHATEHVLYIALRLRLEQTHCWYALNLKPFKNESTLVPIPSCPSLPYWGSSVIAIGYEIYVFGGCIDGELTFNVFASIVGFTRVISSQACVLHVAARPLEL